MDVFDLLADRGARYSVAVEPERVEYLLTEFGVADNAREFIKSNALFALLICMMDRLETREANTVRDDFCDL